MSYVCIEHIINKLDFYFSFVAQSVCSGLCRCLNYLCTTSPPLPRIIESTLYVLVPGCTGSVQLAPAFIYPFMTNLSRDNKCSFLTLTLEKQHLEY